MDDAGIIQLYWDRNEQAIKATSDQYGRYCRAIAKNILSSDEDAEECVNDTYLRAWNAIPPTRPSAFQTWLARIIRNLSLDRWRNLSFNRYRHDRAEKRGGGEMALILDELTDCVSDTDTVEQAIDRQELGRAVNAFVRGLPTAKRSIFVRRYWYADAVSTIAEDCGMRPGAVSKALERTRTQLKAYLTERGFTL